jgi:hypothetical protein
MNMTRSATLRANPISCVTHSIVMPSCAKPIIAQAQMIATTSPSSIADAESCKVSNAPASRSP